MKPAQKKDLRVKYQETLQDLLIERSCRDMAYAFLMHYDLLDLFNDFCRNRLIESRQMYEIEADK